MRRLSVRDIFDSPPGLRLVDDVYKRSGGDATYILIGYPRLWNRILHVHIQFVTYALHIFFQNGLAAFLLSPFPVTGSRNSFQLTGYINLPSSLLAITTPNSLRSVAT